jgi:small subunit ribosomal protein S8e
MTTWHGNIHKKKSTGGRRKKNREKKRYERGSFPTETIVGKRDIKISSRVGGNLKIRLKRTQWVNLSDPSKGKTRKIEIQRILENPSNIDYNRRGVITKGTIIDTAEGTARVTSRPGQSGLLNAILISKK